MRISRALALLVPLSLALLSTAGGAAPQQEPAPFVAVAIGKDARAPAALLEGALREVAARDPDPHHIAVLVHGFDTSTANSHKQYSRIAELLHREFNRQGERVAVVGVQWPSDVGAMREWLPKSLAHHILRGIGLKKAVKDPYKTRVELARPVGRQGMRQVLVALQDRFPRARLHVLAHSLGSEITIHAIDPESLEETEGDRENPIEIFEPTKLLHMDLTAMAGADVDQDHELPSRTAAARVGLYWVTTGAPGARRDQVLVLRKLVRGKAALGNAPPRLRAEQLDTLIGGRKIVFDISDIPRDHDILNYYDEERIRHLAEAAASLRNPMRPRSPVLQELDGVLVAPPDPVHLCPFLTSSLASARVYALWRLEHLYCGGSHHVEDGSALKLFALALKDPKELEKLRQSTECVVFKRGFWPPPDVVKKS